MRTTCWLLILLVALAGCDDRGLAEKKTKPVKRSPWEKKAGSAKTSQSVKAHGPKPLTERPVALRPNRRIAADTSSSLDTRTSFTSAKSAASGQYLTNLVRESVNYAPTLVVWVVDRTDSAAALRLEATTIARGIYQDQSIAARDDQALLTSVVGYGQKMDEPTTPTADGKEALAALEKLARDDSGREATFATLFSALEKFAAYRTGAERREVLFVLVTDEVGDDAAEAEATLTLFKRHLVPVYVLSVPAPLGRKHLGDLKAEARSDGQPGVVIGPESRESEAISIESMGGNYDLEVLDSGFGPFSLEWLARATEGKLLASRPAYHESGFFGLPGTEWPTSRARQFDAEVMKKYAPDYISADAYTAMLQSNQAMRALVDAGKLPRAEVRTQLNLTFAKRNEAQFAKDLSKAQQGAARLEPDINRLFDTLAAGESDRVKLTSPRWQASFDTAMGRACAAKARIEGYNAMLALLKQGKKFANPDSRAWRLEPAENSAEAGSAINKLVERSQMYLKRVAAEHPGTPWALIAERELQEQVGWKWVEE